MTNTLPAFTAHRIATCGCEIKGPEGDVIAWTVDEVWAGVIVALLNRLDAEGLRTIRGPDSYIYEQAVRGNHEGTGAKQ